jgi:hypothetical protein
VLTESAGGIFLREFKVRLNVLFGSDLPDAKIETELYSPAGQQCAFSIVDRPIAANRPMPVTIDTAWVWQMQNCSVFPAAAATLKVTLFTLHEPIIDNRLQRTDYATATVPAPYTVQRYPPPPPNAPQTPPTIAELRWQVALPVGGDPPVAGDPVDIHCTARESDGAALTTTITVAWDSLAALRFTQAFPAGASSSPPGAYFGIRVAAPNSAPTPHAKLTCTVSNDRGQTVSASGDIGTPK